MIAICIENEQLWKTNWHRQYTTTKQVMKKKRQWFDYMYSQVQPNQPSSNTKETKWMKKNDDEQEVKLCIFHIRD